MPDTEVLGTTVDPKATETVGKIDGVSEKTQIKKVLVLSHILTAQY